MQLFIRSDEDLEIVKFYFLRNSFPELESISLDNMTSDVHYFQLWWPLPRLRRLHGERLLFIPYHPLPSLVELDCCTELDCRNAHTGDRRTLDNLDEYPFPLLYAASGAKSLRFLNMFLPDPWKGSGPGPLTPFPNVEQASVEEEWQYIAPTLKHIALPPTARLVVFSHKNTYRFDIRRKGFWLDILPQNRATSLPMLGTTRALWYLAGLYVSEEENIDNGIPYPNAALLSGAPDPSGLYNGVYNNHLLPGGSWTITVTHCGAAEATPVTLREISAIVDCARLLHLEMHTQDYQMDEDASNDWLILLLPLVNLEFMEVGGIHAITMVLGAIEEQTQLILPSLSHLALCHAALPSELPLDPQYILGMLEDRAEGWDKPLQRLTLRLPDQPRGRLAGYTRLIPETLEFVTQLIAGLTENAPTVEVVRKYCKSCHEDDGESTRPESERETLLASYRADAAARALA